MSTYSRTGRVEENRGSGAEAAGPAMPTEMGAGGANDKPIPIDGFNQVLEMLRAADPQFRESLLRRLAARDVALAKSLREDLKAHGL